MSFQHELQRVGNTVPQAGEGRERTNAKKDQVQLRVYVCVCVWNAGLRDIHDCFWFFVSFFAFFFIFFLRFQLNFALKQT